MIERRNANDSHSTIFSRLSKCMSTAKTVFHLLDDPLVATEKALNISDPGFMLAADSMVASVFFIVSAIELQESIKELQELNEEYDEIKDRLDEETMARKAHLKKCMDICFVNIALSGGALIASTALLMGTIMGVSFAGIAFFPFAIMMAILTKQCSEYYLLNDELKHLLAIQDPTPEQSKKITELKDEMFYKRMEITAQALITFGFLASVVAVSIFSAGMAPTFFVIGGAIFGLIFKLHGKYHEHVMEKKELAEKLEAAEAKNTEYQSSIETITSKNIQLGCENSFLEEENASLKKAQKEAKSFNPPGKNSGLRRNSMLRSNSLNDFALPSYQTALTAR